MAQITDLIRQKYELLKLSQAIQNPILALSLEVKAKALAEIDKAKTKIKELNK